MSPARRSARAAAARRASRAPDFERCREALRDLREASAAYRTSQRRRDQAYRGLLAAIRRAAQEAGCSIHTIARIAGLSVTRIRQVLRGPVSRRDIDPPSEEP